MRKEVKSLRFHDTGLCCVLMHTDADLPLKGSFWSEIRLAYGLLPMVSLLEKRGIDPVPSLQQAGIDRFGLLDPGYTIAIERELAFFRSAIRRLREPAASLDLAVEYRVKGFSVLGLAMLACETPLQVLLLLLRYPRLAWGVFDCEIQARGQSLQVDMQLPTLLDIDQGFFIERDLACAQVVISEVMGQAFQFGRIEFQHACRGDRAHYEAFFGGEVVFNAPANRVITPLQQVTRTMPQASPSMLRFYQAQCERMSQALEQPFRFAEAIRQHLERSAVIPGLAQLATEFFMTPRTLQRRLAAEGSAYSALLQQVRSRRAARLLLQTRRNIDSIAEELGFGDAAAFSHAFKSWQGVSPQAFRRDQAAPCG